MATFTKQTIDRDGVQPTYNSVAGGGDEFSNDGRIVIHVKNDNASACNVTIVTPATVDGLAVSDRVVTVPAGEERIIGPFPQTTYSDANGIVSLTWSITSSVTCAVYTF